MNAQATKTMTYAQFMARCYAIIRAPLADALLMIAREIEPQVLTQTMDVAQADRQDAMKRRLAQLTQRKSTFGSRDDAPPVWAAKSVSQVSNFQ